MKHRSRIANFPIRAAAGVIILHSGLSKLKAEEETAKHLHGFASGTYPIVENVQPGQFVKALGATEVALGGALLMPVAIGDGPAGAGLATFATGLLGLYMKTPGMREAGSLRPSRDGIALAKDVWLAGIGLTLMMSSLTTKRITRLQRKAKKHTKELATGT